MMSLLKGAMMLLLVAAGANATLEDCEGLNVTLHAKDLQKVHGDWVLVWAVSDHEEGLGLLPNLSSSHVELKGLDDGETLSFVERNMFVDKSCNKYDINMTVPSDPEADFLNAASATVEKDGLESLYNESGEAQFFQTCEDCMTMFYKSKQGGYLLMYKREGQHQDTDKMKEDQVNHTKLAVCMGFPQEIVFTYDGAADFCPKKPDVVPPVEDDDHVVVPPVEDDDHVVVPPVEDDDHVVVFTVAAGGTDVEVTTGANGTDVEVMTDGNGADVKVETGANSTTVSVEAGGTTVTVGVNMAPDDGTAEV